MALKELKWVLNVSNGFMVVAHVVFVMNYLLFYEVKTKHTLNSELVITLVVFSNTTDKNIL
jgi:hypothetical protein